jgi:hypothetical protein
VFAKLSGKGAKKCLKRVAFFAHLMFGFTIWPKSETVDVWTADHPMQTIGPGGVLDGRDVLPGFTLALADLFA